MAKLREVDALAVVVRCFGADATPARSSTSVRADLLLADLAVIEGALQKAEKKRARQARSRGRRRCSAAKAALDAETPLRDASSTRTRSATCGGSRR